MIIGIVGLPITLWLAFSILVRGKSFKMDSLAPGSFFGTFAVYRETAVLVFWVSMAMAVFSAYKGWPPATYVNAAAAILAFLFVSWLSWCYEGYLAIKTSYSGMRYALTLSLGICSLVYFIAGILTFLASLLER